jgi:putative heme-binding domain-containing protein
MLTGPQAPLSIELKLAALRLTELALLQGVRNVDSDRIGAALLAEFPTRRTEVDAEVARILVVLNVNGAAAKIMPLVEKAQTNGEQLHYALTLRYLKTGWNFDLKQRLMNWYEGTRGWEGGNSLTGYVSNVVGATSEKFTPEERNYFVRHWRKHPAGAALIVRVSQPDQIANFEKIISEFLDEAGHKSVPGEEDLITAGIASLGKSSSPSARASLRRLFEQYPDRRESIARAIATNPAAEDWSVLMRTLQFADKTTLQECLGALGDLNGRPKNAEEYRTVIQAALKMRRKGGLVAIGLLQKWTEADDKAGRNVAEGIAFYQKWYHDKFPSAPPPELPKDDSTKSKYTFQQIAALLEHGGQGSVPRGRLVFTKAKCVKCHRFQSEGEGVGPDLTSVRRRFQQKEIVESIVYPSQVISDQYRMVQVETKEGQVYVGMPIPGVSKNDKLVLLLSDTTKLEIAKSRIEEQTASKISVMPTGLLDPLSLEEVTDLLAFLETSKFNAPVAEAAKK